MKPIILTIKGGEMRPLHIQMQHLVSYQWQDKGQCTLVRLSDGLEYYVDESPVDIVAKVAAAAASVAEVTVRASMAAAKALAGSEGT